MAILLILLRFIIFFLFEKNVTLYSFQCIIHQRGKTTPVKVTLPFSNKCVTHYPFQCLFHQRRRTTPVKVIPQHFTLLKKLRDSLPFIVFNSLERKDNPCKSDSQLVSLFEKNETLYCFQCIIHKRGRRTPVKVTLPLVIA